MQKAQDHPFERKKCYEFFNLRFQEKISCPTTKTISCLQFAGGILGKWKISSYEYILSQLKLTPRTYAFQQALNVKTISSTESKEEKKNVEEKKMSMLYFDLQLINGPFCQVLKLVRKILNIYRET